MTALLWLLFTLSISGSVLALLVLCLSPFLRRWPTLRYYLWLPVVVRLLLPFAPGESLISRVAVFLDTPGQFTPLRAEEAPAAPQVQAPTSAIVYVPSDGEPAVEGALQGPVQGVDAKPSMDFEISQGIAETSRRLASLGAARVLAFLWLFGMGAVLLPHAWGLYQLHYTLRLTAQQPLPEQQQMLDMLCAGKWAPRLRRSRAAATPLAVGLLHPVIVLPDRTYGADELRYILLHELTHVRRLDIDYKWLILLMQSVHWFNPLVWLVGRQAERACEQSCDAAVVGGLDERERIAYCETLLCAAADARRQSLPAVALGEDARELKNRMDAALSHCPLGKKGRMACAALFAAVALLGLLLGCSNGEFEQLAETPEEPGPLYGERKWITPICEQWVLAAAAKDEQGRRELMAPSDLPPEEQKNTLQWLDGREGFELCDYSILVGDDQEGWCSAGISYLYKSDDLALYSVSETLRFQQTADGWQIAEVAWSAGLEAGSYSEFTEFALRSVGAFPPDGDAYTEEDFARMESEHIGLYGLDAPDAAVKAWNLSGGTVIRHPDIGVARCWYHWEDGDLFFVMGHPEGHDGIWVSTGRREEFLNGMSYLEARSMILNGLPGGWETRDELPDLHHQICGLYDPDGVRRCTLAVEFRTGEIFYQDGGELRPFHEAPLDGVLERRSTWEGEFYPYKQENQRTVIHKIGEHAFSYIRPDGTSGNGRFSGNQGWTDDGKYLFLWCADGCNLNIYKRDGQGTLMLDSCERLQSDLFDIRYQERWEQNYGALRPSGLAASEALEILEGALPDGYTAEQRGAMDENYRFAVYQDGEYFCTLLVSSKNAEIRGYDTDMGCSYDFSESPVYPVVAERCAWEGQFTAETGTQLVTFWREGADRLGYRLWGGSDSRSAVISGNQAFCGDGETLYIWDGDTGNIRCFSLDSSREIQRDGSSYYIWLTAE